MGVLEKYKSSTKKEQPKAVVPVVKKKERSFLQKAVDVALPGAQFREPEKGETFLGDIKGGIVSAGKMFTEGTRAVGKDIGEFAGYKLGGEKTIQNIEKQTQESNQKLLELYKKADPEKKEKYKKMIQDNFAFVEEQRQALTPDVMRKNNRQILAEAAMFATELLGGGALAGVGKKAVATAVGKQIAKKSAIKTVGEMAIKGAGVGAGYGTLGTAMQEGTPTVGEYAKGAVTGAVAGAGLGAGIAGVGALLGKGISTIGGLLAKKPTKGIIKAGELTAKNTEEQIINRIASAEDKVQTKLDVKQLSELKPEYKVLAENKEIVDKLTTATKPSEIKSIIKEATIPKKEVPLSKTDDITKEASKYKSAEEFVKDKGDIVFRGTGGEEAGRAAIYGDGMYVSPEKGVASRFGKVDEFIVPKKNMFDATKSLPDDIVNDFAKLYSKKNNVPLDDVVDSIKTTQAFTSGGYSAIVQNTKIGSKIKAFTDDYIKFEKENANIMNEVLKERGFEGVKAKAMVNDKLTNEIVYNIFDPKDIKTKSQLTDIWNKAQEVKTVKPTPQVSKVAKSIEIKSLEKKLTESFDDLAEYTPIKVKEQAEKASKLLSEDIEKAKRIIRGEEDLPSDILGGTMIKSMEDYALEKGDAKLLMDIANSPLTAETSVHAQELRMLAERNPDSAVIKLREVKKAREAIIEKKTGKKVSESVKGESKRIKNEIRKTQTKETWGSFIESITCK